ncbi:MAG: CapA family protein [Aureispira sp.]
MPYFLYTCFLGLFLLSSCQSKESKQGPIVTTIQDTIVTPLDSLVHLRLAFVGDIMGHTNQIRSAAGESSVFKSQDQSVFDYELCFRYITPILERADIAVGNLELTLSNKGRYTGYPMFRSPDALAGALKNASFDLLSTSNNHSNDGGKYGLTHTLDVLDSLGIWHTGTFRDSSERDSLYPLLVEKEINGVTFRLAFVNYTYATNGVFAKPPTFVNWIDTALMRKDIEEAKAMKPDCIIALMHWGHEYHLNEYSTQKATANFLWKQGVDVIIGGHPHVIQPVKTDTIWTADSSHQREVLVAYSLGNFISSQYQPNTDLGLLFELELVKDRTTQAMTLGTHDYLFTWRYLYGRGIDSLEKGFEWAYSVLPVSVFEEGAGQNLVALTPKDSLEMHTVTKRLRKHLAQYQSQEQRVSIADLGAVAPFRPAELLDSTVVLN